MYTAPGKKCVNKKTRIYTLRNGVAIFFQAHTVGLLYDNEGSIFQIEGSVQDTLLHNSSSESNVSSFINRIWLAKFIVFYTSFMAGRFTMRHVHLPQEIYTPILVTGHFRRSLYSLPNIQDRIFYDLDKRK